MASDSSNLVARMSLGSGCEACAALLLTNGFFRINLDTITFTHLKRTVQSFLVSSQDRAAVTTV